MMLDRYLACAGTGLPVYTWPAGAGMPGLQLGKKVK
jgi:hypothetical protein